MTSTTIPSGIYLLLRGKYRVCRAVEHGKNCQFCLFNPWVELPIKWTGFHSVTCLTGVTHHKTHAYFRETAVVQSWICKAGSRTDLTEHLGTDLECKCPFSRTSRLSEAGWPCCREGGWGPGQWLTWCAQKMYGQPICLLSTFIVLSILVSLPFSNFTLLKHAQKVLQFECEKLQYSDAIHLWPVFKYLWIQYDYD